MLGSRDFVLICLVFFGIFFTRGAGLFTLLPLKASQNLHLTPGTIGLLFAVVPAIQLVSLAVVGPLTDRYGRKFAVGPGVAAFSVALLVLAISPSVWLFALGMVLYGVAQGVSGGPSQAYVVDISGPATRAVAQGAARSLGDLGLLVAPPLMGVVADHVGATPTLMANGVLMAVIGILFLALASDPARRLARARPGTPS